MIMINFKSIGSFKLYQRGKGGISITSEQLSKHFQTTKDTSISRGDIYHDEVNTFRRNGVPEHILNAITRLKYFFLNITGHWTPLYDKFIDLESFTLLPVEADASPIRRHLEALWDSAYVTQVKFDHDSFTIMGVMDIIDGKPLNLNPQKVTSEDELEFYGDVRGIIQSILYLLMDYFSTAAIDDIEDYRKYLLEHADESGRTEISKFDEDQLLNRVMDKFAKSGAIITMDNNMLKEAVSTFQEEKLDYEPEPEPEPKPSGSEKSEPVETEVMDGSEDWAPAPDKAPDPFGHPLAEEGQAEQVSSDLEYSDGPDEPEDAKPDILDEIPDEDFV